MVGASKAKMKHLNAKLKTKNNAVKGKNKMAKTKNGEKRIYSLERDKCGAIGRNIEVADRIAGNKRTKVLHCQRYGKVDTTYKIDKKMLKQETKINCGKVTNCFAENIFAGIDLNDRETLEQYILPDCDMVAYGYDVQADYSELDDLFMFSREEFIDFLFGYGKPLLKVNSYKGSDWCLNINTYKNSKVKFEYFQESCLEKMSKREYLIACGKLKEE